MTGPIRKPVPIPPALAGATCQELAELDDRELLAMAGSLPRFSQRRMAARELLVGRYRFLVWSCVQRYNRGPEPVEDLMHGMTQDQIGQQLGMSQMQVSRLLSRALGYLRPRLLGLDEATAR